MTKIEFYRAFEDRHRGSRESVKSRLAVYLPFILPFKQIEGFCQGIDLGCGRGEWLELMQEHGIDVRGVDLDMGMLESAQERELNVSHGDAIKELQSLSDESLSVISGFHLAEHLPFDLLQILIKESLRVLKPGGLLILETPNPENIVVGSANFYIDPTHQRPIPFQLLSFMVEYAGFKRVKVLRLQESTDLAKNNALSLLDVLRGVSPDYAVVAQKEGATRAALAIEPAFEADYGLSLEYLANRYNQQAIANAEQSEAALLQALSQLGAVYASRSWRITKPLRTINQLLAGLCPIFGRLQTAVKLKIKQTIKPFIALGIRCVNNQPALRNRLKLVIARFPKLHQRLQHIAKITSSLNNTNFLPQMPKNIPAKFQNMTPHAQKIYADLKTAIQQHQKRRQ